MDLCLCTRIRLQPCSHPFDKSSCLLHSRPHQKEVRPELETIVQDQMEPVFPQTQTSSLWRQANVSVTMRSQWNPQHFFPLPDESDAHIRENWYANVVLSGCTTLFQHMRKEQTALAPSTMKIKDELPDGNIIVSPNVSVVWSFRQPSFTGQRIPQHFFSEHHEV